MNIDIHELRSGMLSIFEPELIADNKNNPNEKAPRIAIILATLDESRLTIKPTNPAIPIIIKIVLKSSIKSQKSILFICFNFYVLTFQNKSDEVKTKSLIKRLLLNDVDHNC